MNFTNIRPVALIVFTAMLTACGNDWQTSVPGTGGTGYLKDLPVDTSPEFTPLRQVTQTLSLGNLYQITSDNSYIQIAAPNVNHLDDYHWLQTQYQRDNRVSSIWQDMSVDVKTLLPTGEWQIANDKKLILHFNENYAETNADQSLKGKYSVIGDGINLESKGYPTGSIAFNIQYTPYQDEYVIDKTIYHSSYLSSITSIDELINNYQNQWLVYGEMPGEDSRLIGYQFNGNSSDIEGKVQFSTIDYFQGCKPPTEPTAIMCLSIGGYNIKPYPETGTWEKINIAGNSIIKITPPTEVKNLLIPMHQVDRFFVKLANSPDIKVGKFYPANQPINLVWYNQKAMDYILQQGLNPLRNQ